MCLTGSAAAARAVVPNKAENTKASKATRFICFLLVEVVVVGRRSPCTGSDDGRHAPIRTAPFAFHAATPQPCVIPKASTFCHRAHRSVTTTSAEKPLSTAVPRREHV